MTAYVEAPPERIAALIYLISFVRGLALFTTLFALPIAYLIVQLLGSTCSLRGGFSMSAGISAQRDTILKDFPWYYYINSDTREWWIAFYDKLRKRMQRRILELMIQNRLPKGNSYDLSVEWQSNWIDGLWKVISLLNPFRPQCWTFERFPGMLEHEFALERISAALVYTAFLSWHALWFPRGILRYSFRLWLIGSRRSMHTAYSTTCVAEYMSTWDASLQISFVDAMNARNAHMKVAACLERVRLGHRRK